MAFRTSMNNLVRRVRMLIGDHGENSPQVFTEQQIQDAMDLRRRRYRYAALEPVESIAPGGALTFLEYEACIGDWEEDAQIVDRSFNVLTPATKDYLTGRWTFASNQLPPVLINGFRYDVYGAAADLLERWPILLTDSVDRTEGDVSWKNSQARQQKLILAEQYRQKQWPMTVQQVRSDIA